MREKGSRPEWTLEKALELVRVLEPKVRKVGFALGITGSLLITGVSSNDLDLVIYPVDSSCFDMKVLYQVMLALGMERICRRSTVARVWETRYNSSDMKNVEKWRLPDGRIVDVFHLR